MSWSIHQVGRAHAVAKKVTESLAACKCVEPEETIKNQVGAIVQSSLAAMDPNRVVEVSASGSQSKYDDDVVNQVQLSIKPVYGFVE